MDIEKNDVDIENIFRWNREVSIVDTAGKEVTKVYMRIPGDKDINKARTRAIRDSGLLRDKLTDKTSEEYITYIKEPSVRGKENLIKAISLINIEKLGDRARRNVIVKFPKEPKSTASLEEKEKFQKEVDDFSEKYSENFAKELKILVDRQETLLEDKPEDELKDLYAENLVDYLCSIRMMESFRGRCIYYATYKDPEFSQLAFSSYEAFENSALLLKEQLLDAYAELEMSMSDLKK
ncbi:MAG: hypothetical protein ACTSPI_13320 [Candidatus Heimdallarchaeaceae archaeon]